MHTNCDVLCCSYVPIIITFVCECIRVFVRGFSGGRLISTRDVAIILYFSTYYSIQNFPQNAPIIPKDCPIIHNYNPITRVKDTNKQCLLQSV